MIVGQWLRDSAPGRELYAIGSNPDAARLAGVRSDRRVLVAFVLAGALAGLAGVLFAARFGTLDATAGTGFELAVVAAVVVGGVAIFGGSGTVYGAALGALLLGTISSSLIILRVKAFWQQAAIGALLLLAITLDGSSPCASAPPCAEGARAVPTETAVAQAERRAAPRREAALAAAARRARRAGRPSPSACSSSRSSAARALVGVPDRGLVHHRLARHLRDRAHGAPLTLVIVAAEIDLSVASVLALSSALMGYLWNHGLALELIMPICLVVGALCGAFNGVLVTRLGPAVAGGHDRHARAVPRAGLRGHRRRVGHGLPRHVDRPRASATSPARSIPNPIVLFARARGRVRRRAARHAVRALDLRHRRQRGGRVLLRPAREADQADAVRRLRHGGRARRHRHLAAQLDRRRQRRPGFELTAITAVLLGGVSIFGGRGTIVGVILALLLLGGIQKALMLSESISSY